MLLWEAVDVKQHKVRSIIIKMLVVILRYEASGRNYTFNIRNEIKLNAADRLR